MLILSLVLGLVAGLAAGGRITNLASVQLRLVQLLFLGLILRYATQFAIESGNALADDLRLPLFAGGFLLLLIGLWVNREKAGLPLSFVGILLNAVAIVTNGGFMPVWEPSMVAAGLPPGELASAFHRIVGAAGGGIPGDFLAQAGPLGDIIPIPIPFIRNVVSIGDLFLAAGLAFFLFATTVRNPTEIEEAGAAAIRRRLGLPGIPADQPSAAEQAAAAAQAAEAVAWPPTDALERFDSGLVSATALERPLSLGGPSVGSEGTLRRQRWRALPLPVPPILERVRRHAYVRLALDGSFSALWTGQLVSALGDRIHQVALAYVVFDATRSPIAVGAVFLVATLPNLLFGPIAGALVDRWDHREVMIVSDLLRAGLVLLIPIAAVTNLALAYPLVFLVTTVSIFFRPAKGAILPRIVASEDLVPANSALWIGETFADIGGYVIAGLFVALLADQLPLAFWVDSVTYVASALLIASIAVAPASRAVADKVEQGARGVRGALAGFTAELREGWRFLRGDTVLMANTLQATAGQFMLGIFLALTPVYAAEAIDRGGLTDREAYAFIEGAIGAGNLAGGFMIGLVGARLSLGKMVIAGYVVTGALVTLFAVAGNLPLALGLAFGTGVGNLAFVIPSQTLFQRRTPPELMGRVLGLRFSVVFGAMTFAMGIGGVLGEWFGAAPVIGVFGLVTLAAGLAGLFVPAVRDA
ncbi:MAG TPA: MFS transporter [Candidatus Limnocylindria bacterium]|nr:MFS transporter [Candidatus Limnocylindria bacterium]